MMPVYSGSSEVQNGQRCTHTCIDFTLEQKYKATHNNKNNSNNNSKSYQCNFNLKLGEKPKLVKLAPPYINNFKIEFNLIPAFSKSAQLISNIQTSLRTSLSGDQRHKAIGQDPGKSTKISWSTFLFNYCIIMLVMLFR